MTAVVLPLALAGSLPFLLTLLSKAGHFSRGDNHETRAWQTRLDGWRQRAYWAHQNAFETFPHFIAGCLLAASVAPNSTLTVAAAWAYPALRIAYSACYIADLARLRSLMWFLSLGAVGALFVVAL